MHGVYVNGKKITRTEISTWDIIAFGNKVTRAEGEYLSSDQAFNFSEYPGLTSLSAIHEGVSLTVSKIDRDGAIFSNSIDLTEPTKSAPSISHSKPVPQASYRVPDYDTDSSKENSITTTFEQPTPMQIIDLEPGSSPVRSHHSFYSEDEDDGHVYYNDDSDSELGSDHDNNDYPEELDEFDDDEQSYSGSDRSGSSCSAQASDEDDTHIDEIDLEVDETLESQKEPQTAPYQSNDTELVQPRATNPQVQEKEKKREVAEMMSLRSILEPTNYWDMTTVTLTPNSILPPYSGPKGAEALSMSQTEKNKVEIEVIHEEEKVIESQDASLENWQADRDREQEDLDLSRAIAASQQGASEVPVASSSPTGSKRKREIEDDGHEDNPAPSTERKLLKLKFDKQRILKDFFKTRAQTSSSRPTKRAKRSTARFALGAVAGAIGGVATVVGVLMTPACEELLSTWPIA
jgi:hypothetical protein